MCGIAGILHWGKRDVKTIVATMSVALAHRGPDGKGQTDLPDISIAHRRLSIIDLSESASQPMWNSGSRFCISFNGEIYNYATLRAECEKEGSEFKTRSDTEVILEAYHHWGVGCVKKFHGMFAFVIWDNIERTLFIARDRFGKKPLYYSMTSGGFSFASELSALMKDPAIGAEVSMEALNCYLALGYILSPLSYYTNAKKLPQATWMLISDSGKKIKQEQYWNYSVFFQKKTTDSPGAIAEKLQHLFEQAIMRRLVSDVPVGAFLSGGIDSSAVVAFMRPHYKEDLHTFSVGFEEGSYNESVEASRMAELFKTIHHGNTLGNTDGAGMVRSSIEAFDEPFCDNSMIPMLYVSKLAATKLKVVLSGDGADELFAGYITYKADRYYHTAKKIPAFLRRAGLSLVRGSAHSSQKINFKYKLRQFLHGSLQDEEIAHYSWRLHFHPEERVAILGEKHRELIYETDPSHVFKEHYSKVQGLSWLDKHLYVDGMTWLCDDILVKVDRTTMASGLEARAPFLDHELAEYAASVPCDLKLKGNVTKFILKSMLKGKLPDDVLYRKKSGFNAPVGKWLGVTHLDEFRSFNKFVFDSFRKNAAG